uniref:Uncharacterized protein n=1 Tax=Crocodylus porosus TaxID=8502 RepID=A0A7M4E8E0_CROPO
MIKLHFSLVLQLNVYFTVFIVVCFMQSRFSIILKGPRIFGMRVSLSFEGLKPGIDFSLAMKALDGIFFQYKAVSSTLKICCLV